MLITPKLMGFYTKRVTTASRETNIQTSRPLGRSVFHRPLTVCRSGPAVRNNACGPPVSARSHTASVEGMLVVRPHPKTIKVAPQVSDVVKRPPVNVPCRHVRRQVVLVQNSLHPSVVRPSPRPIRTARRTASTPILLSASVTARSVEPSRPEPRVASAVDACRVVSDMPLCHPLFHMA